MAGSRRSRLRRAVLGQRANGVPPTRQTVERLRPDVVAGLLRDGRIGLHHARSAQEIRTVCEAAGRGMTSFLRPELFSIDPARRRGGEDFLDRMTERERRLWLGRFLPWTRRMLAGHAELPGARLLDLVLGVVVDNRGLRETETAFRLKHGRAVDLVLAGLELYADRARGP